MAMKPCYEVATPNLYHLAKNGSAAEKWLGWSFPLPIPAVCVIHPTFMPIVG